MHQNRRHRSDENNIGVRGFVCHVPTGETIGVIVQKLEIWGAISPLFSLLASLAPYSSRLC
jgi:hypothetical protein